MSELEKQMGLQNLSFNSNAQGNNIGLNNNTNPNQSFNMFQNRMSGQSNGKMSIDSIGYNPNLLAGLSGIGGACDALNNISPDKSMNSIRDSYRNNSLFPSQMERKTIGGMSNIERLSECHYDPNFDIGLNSNQQRSSIEDTIMANNRNSQFQNSIIFGNSIYQSNRHSNGLFGGFQSQNPYGSMYNNNLYMDDKLILQSTTNQQNQPLSFRINVNQFGFSNPQYLQQTQTTSSSQMQSTIGEPIADSAMMGINNNPANLEYQNFEKLLSEQFEQTNRNPGDMVEQFAITSSTNQVTYPSSVSAPNQNFYNLNAAPQNISQSQFRFASGLSSGNTAVPLIGIGGAAQPNANLINVFNQNQKQGFSTDLANIYNNDPAALKFIQQQQQQQQRQIILSSGSGMMDISAINFGNGAHQSLLQQQLNGQSNSSMLTAATVGGVANSYMQEKEFDPIALMNNLKTENVADNEGNDSDKTEKDGQKDDKDKKRQAIAGFGRGAAFTTKQENQEDMFNSMLNPFEDNQEGDRQMSLTNDSINKINIEKMSLNSHTGINRSLQGHNKEVKKENMNQESLSLNEIKQEKESIGGLGDLGSAINFQNNSFNLSAFASGGNLSIQRGSNFMSITKNNRASLMNRLSSQTRNSNQRNSENNRISFPTFDYDQKLILENNGIPYRDQNGNLIVPSSNRSSAINSESIMQDEEERNKKKGEEILACNCGKTKCLKLYCVCFQQGLMCNDQCRCTDCYNRNAYMEERERAIKAIKIRYPEAFEKKVNVLQDLARKLEDTEFNELGQESQQQNAQILGHKRGCNCKKSACKKKYCECYLAGVKCTYLCRCESCQNGKNDGPEQQGQHISIEGQNFIDQENYNKGNVVSIKTENNAFGNIKLEVFRPMQQQFITKIERNSNQFNENGQFEGNSRQQESISKGQINMENDDFNDEKLNHSRFTYSELENQFTQRKKQKNNDEDIFEQMVQENKQSNQFDQLFNNNEPNQQNDRNSNTISNNNNNNDNNNYNNEDLINQQHRQPQLSQQQMQFMRQQMQQQQQQQQKQQNNNNNNNVNLNNFQNDNTDQNKQAQDNRFDFSIHRQSEEETGNQQRKNMQFINMRRGTTDDNDFLTN